MRARVKSTLKALFMAFTPESKRGESTAQERFYTCAPLYCVGVDTVRHRRSKFGFFVFSQGRVRPLT
jgi:hypothetical protein